MTTLVLFAAFAPLQPVQSLFVKVGPSALVPGRTAGQERAVVLIHGLGLHPLQTERVITPRLRGWQQAGSPLVRALSRHADVFAFAYGQTAPAERVAEAAGLARHVARLKADGYREIILVGHSAGGLVARHLIEDCPDCGVTRAVQVCTPNTGCPLAALRTAREVQSAFLASLSRGAREKLLAARADRKLPDGVEFACIVASIRLGGDGIVGLSSQWSEDLRRQGVPAVQVRAGHKEILTGSRGIEAIVKMVTDPAPRWTSEKVIATRKAILGK